MGTHFNPQITVATAEGPVKILTEEIIKIEKAPDHGAIITFQPKGQAALLQVLTIESFIRILTYFSK